MAGGYPDVPDQRFAWDADGTIALVVKGAQSFAVPGDPPSSPWVAMTGAEKTNINDEDPLSILNMGSTAASFVAWIFPEKRDIDGLFFNSETGSNLHTDTSVDTTNAVDGAWVDQSYTGEQNVIPDSYRDDITGFSLTGIRAIRWYNDVSNNDIVRCHMYGRIASGETPDRILFLDEVTGLEFGISTAPEIMDFGDRPRGSILDHEFRLRNNSTVAGNNLTANTIDISREDLYLDMASWIQFSDGGAFMDTEAITSLAPETNSVLLTLRLDVAAAAVLGLHAARTKVAVTSWT